MFLDRSHITVTKSPFDVFHHQKCLPTCNTRIARLHSCLLPWFFHSFRTSYLHSSFPALVSHILAVVSLTLACCRSDSHTLALVSHTLALVPRTLASVSNTLAYCRSASYTLALISHTLALVSHSLTLV
jgi:hypothetical protein